MNTWSGNKLINVVRKAANTEACTTERFIKNIASIEVKYGALTLDIGSGSSPYRRFFGQQHYISTDLRLHGANLDFLSDALRIPIADESVDAIISTQVLEHITDPEMALKECYRILRPGGKLFLTAPQAWELHQEPHHYFNFTKYGLELLFQRAGFELEQITPRGGYFYFMSNKIRYSSQIFKYYLNGRFRVLLYPFFVLYYMAFSLVIPILLSGLDWLDKEKKLTLGYQCVCVKREL